jgi:hypothetical protein
MIVATLTAWSESYGMDEQTLKRKLTKSGYVVKLREDISAKVVLNAIMGDKAEAEVRLKLAQAIDQERKNKIADGEMIPLAENLAWQDRTLMPIRQRLLSLSGAMAHLCNPTDPKHAEDQLTRWVNETLSMLRTEIGKVDK